MQTAEEYIKHLEETAVLEYLEKTVGTKPSKADKQMFEQLTEKHPLPPGVVNVIIDYSLLTTKKLNRKYLEKVFATLAKKQIKTVSEAMNHFKERNMSQTGTTEERKERIRRNIIDTAEIYSVHDAFKMFFNYWPKQDDRALIYDLLFEYQLKQPVIFVFYWYFSGRHEEFNHKKVRMLALDMIRSQSQPPATAAEAFDFIIEKSEKAAWRFTRD